MSKRATNQRLVSMVSALSLSLSVGVGCSGESDGFNCKVGYTDGPGFRFETKSQLEQFARDGCTESENQDFMVYYVPGVTDLEALGKLKSVRSTLEIGHTEDLQRLDGLQNLERVEELSLVSNQELTDLSALSSLRQGFYEGTINSVYIGNNDQLGTLEGLEGIEQVAFSLIIEENDQLASLDGLSSLQTFLDTPYDTKIVIRNNPNLPTCEAEAFAERFDNVDAVIISGNDDTARCE